MILYDITMAFEIELKAHISDSEALKRLLFEKTKYEMAFTKDDTYWYPGRTGDSGISGDRAPNPLPSGLRIRRENKIFEDGKEESSISVTFKIKEVKDGIEINNEQEFEINSLPVFEELLKRLGLIPGHAKKKRGWAFTHNGINIELTEVEGLGTFVELEILADNKREETIASGREKLMQLLDSLGIEQDAIESRFYSEMLRSQAKL